MFWMLFMALILTYFFETPIGLLPLLLSLQYQSSKAYIGLALIRTPIFMCISVILAIDFNNILYMALILGAVTQRETRGQRDNEIISSITPLGTSNNPFNNIPAQKEPVAF